MKINELFDLKTAFPLIWDEKFAAYGEVHASAVDNQYREIAIHFVPALDDINVIEVSFTRSGRYDITNQGDAARVMSTVINAISIFTSKYKPKYLVFSSKLGSRASAYEAMVKRVARGYKLLPLSEYPDEVAEYLETIVKDQPFVLARL